MAKGAYIGVNGIARKIKKAYIGVPSASYTFEEAGGGSGGQATLTLDSKTVECWSSTPVVNGQLTTPDATGTISDMYRSYTYFRYPNESIFYSYVSSGSGSGGGGGGSGGGSSATTITCQMYLLSSSGSGTSVARKIKKAYIGVGGVARLFYNATPQLKRWIVNDENIVPTGSYAELVVRYDEDYGVKIGYCHNGDILLSMKSTANTSYENLIFKLNSAPNGVTITSSKQWGARNHVEQLYTCVIHGISSPMNIAIDMDVSNGTYDHTECQLTITNFSASSVPAVSRLIANDENIVPTGTYADLYNYYDLDYGVKVGYCYNGDVLLSMKGGQTSLYENLHFELNSSSASGVTMTASLDSWDTSNPYGNEYICVLHGVQEDMSISINMDTVNADNNSVTCSVTVI